MSSKLFAERPRLTALALLLLCAIPTVFMGMHQSRLRIDAENSAMKSRGTREALDARRMQQIFGSDHTVVCGFVAPAGLSIEAVELDEIRDLTSSVNRMPGVDHVGQVERPDVGMAMFEVTLAVNPIDSDRAAVAAAIVAKVRALAPSTLTVHVTGAPLIESRIAHEVDRERSTIVPAIVVALFVLLWWTYRSAWIAVSVLLPAGVSILWTGGLLELFGHELDPLLVLLDPLVLTVAVAVSVHMVETFLRLRATLGPVASAAAVRRELWEPVLLTTLTSMVGFFSLLLSPIPAIGNFGVFAALGVALSACVATWTVPIWLAAFAPARVHAPQWRTPVFRYVAWLRASAGRVLLFGGLAAGLLILESGAVHVDNDPLRILTADDPTRESTEWLADRLGGVETIGMMVPADSPGAAPEMLALLTANLLDQPLVVHLRGPPRRAENGDVLVRATIARSGSASRESLFDTVEEFHADIGCADVHLVGSAVQIARDSGGLIRSQMLGLLLVVPLLGLMVGIGMRSLRLGLLSLIPNAMPCLLLHGGMAWAGRPLSVATVMIGSVMMGLIVDDTIHLLHGYREALRSGRSRRMAIADALRSSGRAITVTSIVLFIGLGVGVTGSLSSTVEFSALAAITIAVAWLLDILILPCILLIRRGPKAEQRLRARWGIR